MTSVPPRCFLVSLFTEPEVEVIGYGADHRVEVSPQKGLVIGRSTSSGIQIRAAIGGHRTYLVSWRPPFWILKKNNEHAQVSINGVWLRELLGKQALCHLDVIEIASVSGAGGRAVHRLRVELE